MATKTQIKAKEIYKNFLLTLDTNLSYSIPEFNNLFTAYIEGQVPLDGYDTTLLVDAIWDCEDDHQFDDGLTDTVGTFPDGF